MRWGGIEKGATVVLSSVIVVSLHRPLRRCPSAHTSAAELIYTDAIPHIFIIIFPGESLGSSIRKCKWWAFRMAFKSCRRVGTLSKIIVSNSFLTFRESICTLIHKRTTIHQKEALLFNIHPCILMGYFSNNAADNNTESVLYSLLKRWS